MSIKNNSLENPVAIYLKKNIAVNYSIKTLAKRLSLSRKSICYYYHQEQKDAIKEQRNPQINSKPYSVAGSYRYNDKKKLHLLSC